jgi:hypothetical protein
MEEEIISRLESVLRYSYIDCPECENIDDDQYSCCLCENTNKHINVLDYLKKHPEVLQKL